MPAVPCTSSVESPGTAAARCSEAHNLAMPGTLNSSSTRLVASMATATSIGRWLPTCFGVIYVPLGRVMLARY